MSTSPKAIPEPTVRRLTLYLRHLEQLTGKGMHKISSRQLGEDLHLGPAQVRRDLATFGQFGQPGMGYKVASLVEQLRKVLGVNRVWKVVLVGAGQLGQALLRYEAFDRQGFHFVAAFDTDPFKIGKKVGAVRIVHLDTLEEVIRAECVQLAILAVPAAVVPQVVEKLTKAGIHGILNFAPTSIEPIPGVVVDHVDVTAHLEQLSFRVIRMLEETDQT